MPDNHFKHRRTPRRAVYLVPNMFTALALLGGYYSIVKSIEHEFVLAGWAIILAAFFDMLDGRIARLTNAQSEFGKQFDSLADVVSFGVAPGILAFQWGLEDFGRLGFAVGFFFAAATAVRLARFNVAAMQQGNFFVGLPSPVAGVIAASLILVIGNEPTLGQLLMVCVLLVLIAATMVSEIKYYSFKQIDFRQQINGSLLILAALLVMSIAVLLVLEYGAGGFLTGGLIYLIYGYFLTSRVMIRQGKMLRARGESGFQLVGKVIAKFLRSGYRDK